jgi:hypothetical protein
MRQTLGQTEMHGRSLVKFGLAATVVAVAVVSPALANTITFETASIGGFTGPVTESGFSYSTLSGGLFVNSFGNPGHNMEGTEAVGGGVLKIIQAGGGNFDFNDLDFAANQLLGVGTQTLVVQGLLGGSLVGVDQYTLPNNSVYVTETASVLAGKTLSELDITLNAGTTPETFTERIDNVVLTPVPEPNGLLVLLLGLPGIMFYKRRRIDRPGASVVS